MPELCAGHRALEVLIGAWRGTERMHPSHMSPQGGTVDGLVRNARALDGFAIMQEYEQSRGGIVHFRGHGIFRFDAATGRHALHWFDSLGHAPTLFEGSMDGGRLHLEHAGSQGSMRADWDFTQPGRYDYSMDISFGGNGWIRFMDARYDRIDK